MYICFIIVWFTGADFAPPPLPPASLVLWKAIFAGGVAGIMSRTATAPLEKLKLLAQVHVLNHKHSHVLILIGF